MAAPTYGVAGTYRQGSTANPAFAAPASITATSIVVLDMYLDAGATINTLPSGFVHAPGSPLTINSGGGGEHTIVRLWARNPAGATYTVALSASVYSNGQASRVDGCVSTGDPWDTNSGTGTAKATSTDVLSGVCPSVSMTTQNADQLLWYTGSNWGGGAWTPATGTTERLDTGDQTLTVDTLAQTTAGGTGSLAATCATSDRRGSLLGSLLSTAISSGTNLNPGNDAVAVAAQGATLAVSTSAGFDAVTVAGQGATLAVARSVGFDAVAVAAQSATLAVARSVGFDAATVAGQSATLAVSAAVGFDAVGVAAQGVTLTSGTALQAGNDAVAAAAQGATLAVAAGVGFDPVGVAAQSASPAVARSAGFDAVAVAAQSATLAPAVGAGYAPVAVAAQGVTLSYGIPLALGYAAAAVAGQDVVLRLGEGGLVGNAHGPLPVATGAVIVHTGTIAGAVT